MSNEVMEVKKSEVLTANMQTAEGFGLLQRMARMFNSSTLVPKQFIGERNFGNCVIALNMAQRMNADPLMVMQNLYVVYGNPAWSSKFMIAMFNQCGRFSSIKYKETGTKGDDSQGVVAFATELATGELVMGPEITIGMAKAEGWYEKNGSKWQTMPDLMLRYRAATFLIRLTAPELSMGLPAKEEVLDAELKHAEEVPFEVLEATANTELLVEEIPTEDVAAEDSPNPKAKKETVEEQVVEDAGF